ncbi:hypothetical protein [Chlorogloeopsis sp. ULAP02]|uniref:hypothetical protein n=1 Tax=Chlorogloeopsis sp. ULAP02 TaxID=3107926 RepID=UPI003134A46D
MEVAALHLPCLRVYDSRYNALNPTPGATTGGTPKGALPPQRTGSPTGLLE